MLFQSLVGLGQPMHHSAVKMGAPQRLRWFRRETRQCGTSRASPFAQSASAECSVGTACRLSDAAMPAYIRVCTVEHWIHCMGGRRLWLQWISRVAQDHDTDAVHQTWQLIFDEGLEEHQADFRPGTAAGSCRHLERGAHGLLAHLALVHVPRRLVVVAVRRQAGDDAQHRARARLGVRVRRAGSAARATVRTPAHMQCAGAHRQRKAL